MRLSVILLNYNQAKNVIAMYRTLDRICRAHFFVVDNCSKDAGELKEFFADKGNATLIFSSENGGYAKGNNLGLRRAFNQHYDYALVINSDVIIKDKAFVKKLEKALVENTKLAVVSPLIKDVDGYLYNPEVKRPSFFDMTFLAFLYRRTGRRITEKRVQLSYRPQGSAMLLNLKLCESVGFLDEATFLFYEEAILAERLRKQFLSCGIVTDTYVIHPHSKGIIDAFGVNGYREFYRKSYRYYLEEYRKYTGLRLNICMLFFNIKLLLMH